MVSGCAHKVKLISAAGLSMSHTSKPPGTKLQSIGDITATSCKENWGDESKQSGIIDEALKAAQKQKKVHFISNATIWYDG